MREQLRKESSSEVQLDFTTLTDYGDIWDIRTQWNPVI